MRRNTVFGSIARPVASPQRAAGIGGVGILSVLLVVAVVATIATKQTWRAQIDIAQAGNRWQSLQANAYVRGAETLAVIALQRDKTTPDRPPIDTLNEEWAQPFDFPTDHGFMQIRIRDEQAKLNINALNTQYGRAQNGNLLPSPARYSAQQRQFIRLLQQLMIDEERFVSLNDAEAIMDAVLDWIDADQNVSGFGGAEQDFYGQLELPYTISNAPMLSVSELRRIRGITPILYQQLLPHVTALEGPVWLNLNTMGPALLRTLNYEDDLSPLDEELGERVVIEIRNGEFEDLEQLSGALELVGLTQARSAGGGQDEAPPQLDTLALVYASDWFEMSTTVTVGDTVQRLSSRIDRSADRARIERRSDSNIF